MSHGEQLAFFATVADTNEMLLDGARLLEIGSYDVNGSVRTFFAAVAEYVGVDLTEGPGVDVVAYGHEVDAADASFDLTISGECFEHDPHWKLTFANMVRLTRPGGLVAFTCASSGRPEHGTARTRATDSPGTQSVGLDYYRNLTAGDFAPLPLDDWFTKWRFWYMPTSMDLYFAGVRTGASDIRLELPSDYAVRHIRRLMSVPHRVVRWPLRVARGIAGDGEKYQRLILPYWLTMLRAFGTTDDDRILNGHAEALQEGSAG